MPRQCSFIICLLTLSVTLSAQLRERALDNLRGKEIIDFSLKDVITNKMVSLRDFDNATAIVFVFTSNYCPYAKIYEDRLQLLHDEFGSKNVKFVLINSNSSNLDDKDSIEKMKQKAKVNGYEFPYLADKKGIARNIFMAEKTPETFVVIPKDQTFIVAYQGAIDDNPQSPDQVESNYIRLVLENIISGKPGPITYKRPVGCRIKTDS